MSEENEQREVLALELNKVFYSVQEAQIERTEVVLTTLFDYKKKTYINLPYNELRRITPIVVTRKKGLFSKPETTEGLYLDFQKVGKPVFLLAADMGDAYQSAKEKMLDFAKRNHIVVAPEQRQIVLVKMID